MAPVNPKNLDNDPNQQHVAPLRPGSYKVDPLPSSLNTVHRYPAVYVSQEALDKNPDLILNGIVKVTKSGPKALFIHAYLRTDESMRHAENAAMDDIMRDNIQVRVSGIVKLEMCNELPFASTITLAPLSEDMENLNLTEDARDQFLMDNYIKPYFNRTGETGEIPAGLVTLNKIFYPGNVSVRIGFKVTAIEPEINVETDPTGANASKFNGALVTRDRIKNVYIAEPVQGKDPEAVRFEDIGGLDQCITEIRELVELPIRHPKFFQTLGIKPTKGILLSGPPGTGKTLIGKALAYEIGAHFCLVNGPEIMSKMAGESESNIRKIFEEAEKQAPSIIFIDELDSIAPKRDKTQGEVEKRVVAQLLTQMDGVKSRKEVFVIGATNRPNHIEPALRRFGRFSREVVIGVCSDEGRRQILQIHTRKMKLSPDIDFDSIVRDTQGYVGADIAQLCHEAAMQVCVENYGLLLNNEEENLNEDFLDSLCVKNEHFEKALTSVNPSSLREAQVEIPNVKWTDVGGLQSVKDNLVELIQWPIMLKDVMKKFGLPPASGVLFYGPPGCGKTLMAKAIATECKANFISVKGPELLTMWHGESESNVREIFSKAKQAAPCVLFFDEIDSMGAARGNSPGDSGVSDRVMNTILTEMDGIGSKKNIFIIGATNRPDILDTALLRPGRLDQMMYIPPPDLESRKQIIKIAFKDSPIDETSISIDELASNTADFSGADVTEICRNACRVGLRRYMQGKAELLQQSNGKAIPEIKTENNAENGDENMEIEEDQPTIIRADCVEAMKNARKSITAADLQKYAAFAKRMNSSSINMPEQFGSANGNGINIDNDEDLYD